MDFFVNHPERILVGAAILAAAELVVARGWRPSRRVRDHGLLLAAVAWLGAALWEQVITTTSPEANIRIDLLLVAPAVLAATVAGIILEVRRSLQAAATS